jgi:hypothetical protein
MTHMFILAPMGAALRPGDHAAGEGRARIGTPPVSLVDRSATDGLGRASLRRRGERSALVEMLPEGGTGFRKKIVLQP